MRASAILVLTLLAVAGSSMPSAQTPGRWAIASTLTASNAGEDDHLGAGNALTGASLGLSRDGRTLAVAAPHEDSDARGVNGNQGNDSAFDSGAVYVFQAGPTGFIGLPESVKRGVRRSIRIRGR
jgi:hypothetical protein